MLEKTNKIFFEPYIFFLDFVKLYEPKLGGPTSKSRSGPDT